MKIKLNMLRLILALVILSIPGAVCLAADVGTAFSYQGRLYDSDSIANGHYDFKFKLFDDPTAAAAENQIGSEILKSGVEVSDGNFTVELDFGNDAFTGDARWLEIYIRPGGENNYEKLVPRQEIKPTPYALKSMQGSYEGVEPVNVDNELNTIGLNPATKIGDLMTWDGNNWIARPPAVQEFNLDNKQPFLGVNFIIALWGTYPSRNSAEPFIAEIIMFAGNFAPRGWAFCDGQLLPISSYDALFSLLGTTYGGDGRTTFGLPDMRGRVPIHPGTGPGLPQRRLGEKGGNDRITFTVQ